MNIRVFDDYEGLSRAAANHVLDLVKMKPKCTLGLATGKTPVALYRTLCEDQRRLNLDWKEVKTYNLDEYCGIEEDHIGSYRYFMEEHLFKALGLNREQTFIPQGRVNDFEQECLRYDALLEATGGLDLQILGIGANGHIGFNEPNSCFIPKTHITALAPKSIEDNYAIFGSVEDMPKHAITMGIKPIINAKKILILASGKSKAPAVKEMIEGSVCPQMPASILNLHPNVWVLLDKEAASELQIISKEE